MNQTQNLSMRQATPNEMGLTSITSMFAEISQNTVSGSKFLDSLQKNFDKLNIFIGESISSLLPTFSLDYFKKKDKHNFLMNNISDKLNQLTEYFLSQSKPVENNVPEILNTSIVSPIIQPTTIVPTNTEVSPEILPPTINNTNKKTKENDFKVGGIPELTEFIKTISKELNKKLFNKMNDFNISLEKMLSFDEKKAESFGNGIGKLNKILENLVKYLKPAAISILGLVAGFFLLGMITKTPAIILSLITLTIFIWGLTKVLGDKILPNNMMQFSAGILILVGAMFAITFVPFASIFKMITFIGLLGFVFRSHIGKASLPMQMIQFATGIAILTLALFAFTEIPFMAIFKMITFIGLFGLVLKMINKPGTFGPGPKMSAILSFGMGLGIMVLALFAFNEVPWDAVAKLLVFIGILGLEIIMINKLSGGAGFTKGLPGFAFGLGLLVLAMFAMNELPWQALGTTLLFLGGLGIVLKLFGPKTGITMALVGGGILAISAAFWVFKQTNFTVNDALIFAGSLAIIGAVILLFGIPAVAGLLIVGSIALIGISIASILIALSLSLISTIKISYKKVGNFVLAVGILALGFAAIAIPAVPGLIGAILFLPITLSALLAAGTIALISIIKINNSSVINFMLSVGILTLGFAAIAIPAVPGLVGAILFLPIAISALLAVGILSLISLLKINNSQITKFMFSVGILTLGFAAIAIPAVPGAVGAILFLPIAISALLAVGILSLISIIKTNNSSIVSFMLSVGILTLGFAAIAIPAVLGAVGATLFLPIAIITLLTIEILALLSASKINNSSIANFMLSVGILTLGFVAIAIPAVVGLVGAGLFLPIAISTLLSAGILSLISILKINNSSIVNFMLSVGILTLGFGAIAIPAVIGLVGAGLFIPIAISTLLAVGILSLISLIKISNSQTVNFMLSVGIITLGFAAISIPAVLGLVGAGLFIPIAISTLLAAGTISLISKIKVNKEQISNFMSSIKLLTYGFASMSIPAVAGLVGAELFLPIANIALTGIKTLSLLSKTQIDNKKISEFGIGMKSLISSFNEIGLISAGKAAVKGKLLIPLINISKTAINLFDDLTKIDIVKGSVNLLILTNTFSSIMEKLETWKNKNATNSIKNIHNFVDNFRDFNEKEFTSITNTMSEFLNSLADDKKWNKINNHLAEMKKNFKDIVTNINMINLNKALLFNDTLKILSTKDTNENLSEVIKNLKEMIGLLYEQAKVQQNIIAKEVDTKSSIIPIDKTNKTETPVLTKKQMEEQRQQLDIMNSFVDALEAVTLKVSIVDQNINKMMN